MFFPTRSTQLDNPVHELFEVLQDNKELIDIAADRAYNPIGKEENKVTWLG